jgi:hypothetical protein
LLQSEGNIFQGTHPFWKGSSEQTALFHELKDHHIFFMNFVIGYPFEFLFNFGFFSGMGNLLPVSRLERTSDSLFTPGRSLSVSTSTYFHPFFKMVGQAVKSLEFTILPCHIFSWILNEFRHQGKNKTIRSEQFGFQDIVKKKLSGS